MYRSLFSLPKIWIQFLLYLQLQFRSERIRVCNIVFFRKKIVLKNFFLLLHFYALCGDIFLIKENCSTFYSWTRFRSHYFTALFLLSIFLFLIYRNNNIFSHCLFYLKFFFFHILLSFKSSKPFPYLIYLLTVFPQRLLCFFFSFFLI